MGESLVERPTVEKKVRNFFFSHLNLRLAM